MKLRNFLIIAGIAAAGLVAVLYSTCVSDDGDEDYASSADTSPRGVSSPASAPSAPSSNVGAVPGAPDTGSDTGSAPTRTEPEEPGRDPRAALDPAGGSAADATRPVDNLLLGWAGKDLGSKKRKDIAKGRPFKINLYQDAGKTTVNRAKVDLDRDEQWDEKWTFDGTNISRKVSPDDDGNYSVVYVWNGSAWAR